MASTLKITRIETGETNESSLASLDFAHTNLSVTTAERRYHIPISQSFIDLQHYANDPGHIVTLFDSIKSQQSIQLVPTIRLNEKDILKIASFDQSIGTLVYVVRSIATLYTSDFDTMTNLRD
ncbi:unnamed protein product [Rotaria sp. Silwood1]|nr:unnamed protein product [Rotaria sp. Silwood1]CAF0995233.1 unnamed protein product [Rotaria sp. Silwood1]